MKRVSQIFKKPATLKTQHTLNESIFKKAQTWADDYYTMAVASKARYQLLAFAALAIVALQALALLCLLPLKTEIPLEINHYPDGYITVTPLTTDATPNNRAEMESELVRYITSRESYSEDSYPVQFSLVNLMSSDKVSREYMDEQSVNNQNSVINQLASTGTQTVHVDNLIFLDNENIEDKGVKKQVHKNIAKVDFSVTVHDEGKKISKSYTVLMSWHYRGMPESPADKWRNWDGFTVTQYEKEERNIGN